MTKHNLQILYDNLRLENEVLKQFILLTNGKQALDRVQMQIAVERTNYALEHDTFT